MEFDVVNTPCPGYKTLKRRYTILAFRKVNIKLTQKKNMVKQQQKPAISNLPKMTSSSLRLTTEML